MRVAPLSHPSAVAVESPYRSVVALWIALLAMAVGLSISVGLGHLGQSTFRKPVLLGYQGLDYGLQVSATAEKAESKLWWNDGDWWGDLIDPVTQQRHIFRLDPATETWENTGTLIDADLNGRGDSLWDDSTQKLYIATRYSVRPAMLSRFSYDPELRQYSLDPGFPVSINDSGSQSIVLAKDSTGRLWITYPANQLIWVNHSLSDDREWGTPRPLPFEAARVRSEDLSAVVHFGGNRIGVLWSNQDVEKFFFATHEDGEPAQAWSLEVADGDPDVADNHVNLKAGNDGRVYAAVKTSIRGNGPDAPHLELLVREPGGRWHSYKFGRYADEHTTPVVMLDEENRRVYMFAARPGGGMGGGTIYMKAASMDNLEFPPGLGRAFIASSADPRVHNPTSTKQNLNGDMDMVVLASDRTTGRYLHNRLDLRGGDSVAFAVVGDYGDDADAGPDVRSVAQLVLGWNPAFVVTTGDNNYPDGEAETIDANVGKHYHDFIHPYQGGYGITGDVNRFFPALGNHDWAAPGAHPHLDYFALPGNERYYDVTWGPVHLFVLDSEPKEPDGVTPNSRQARWLRERLAQSDACWKLVVAHHPPYSSSTAHAAAMWIDWPFPDWGADALLSGHNHVYERVMLDGFPYITNGLGGDGPDLFGPPIPNSEVRFNGDLGAMRVEATKTTIVYEFYTRRGELIDHFEQTKICR